MTQPAFSSQTLYGNRRHSAMRDSQCAVPNPNLNDERGYALVALLVVMSLMALFAMAAASNVKQQAQREREKEAIFRGEQVADAIRSYYRFRGGQGVNSLPTNMDQLLEGIPGARRSYKFCEWRQRGIRSPVPANGS